MSSFVEKIDENDTIKEIEKVFLEELYNLKLEDLEDLEKIATSKETENILNFFKNTNETLIKKTGDELTKILESIEGNTQINKKKDDDDDEEPDNNDSDNDDEDHDNNDSDNDDEDHDSDNEDDDGSIKSHNNSDEEKEEEKEEEEEEKEEEEENTIEIEEQIKNSALEAVRYKIELEKEKSYAGAYPRKQVGIRNTGVSCYLNSAYQMFYSLPFYRNFIMNGTSSLTQVESSIKNSIFSKLNAKNEQWIDVDNQEYCPHTTSVDPTQQDDPDRLFEYIFYTSNSVNNYSNIVKDTFFINMKQTVTCMNDDKFDIITNTDYEYSIYFFLQQYIEYINLNSQKENQYNIQNLIDKYTDYKAYTNKKDNPKDDRCTTHDGNVQKYEYKLEIPHSNRYIFIKLERRGLFNNELDNTIVIPDKKIKINNIEYTLSGAIVHIGASGADGHYIYYQCNEKGEYTTKYDDNTVSGFNSNETDFINKNAKVFAYTRYPVDQSNVDKKTQIKIITETNTNPNVFRPITPN
jgi:hypothetical protein